jgi:predicted nucleic acid-binding protein
VKYLLDTCVISELVKPAPDIQVLGWLAERDEDALFLSVLTIGEIQKGIAKLVSGRRKETIQRWLDAELRRRFAERLLPVDDEVATTWGLSQAEAERQGTPISTIDGLLGATAIVHNLAVATRDVSGIRRTGARVVNPWESGNRG